MYNGFKNYETWNVALWLQNDETLYHWLVGWIRHLETGNASNAQKRHPYISFIRTFALERDKTGDGVRFDSRKVSHKELDDVLREMIDD